MTYPPANFEHLPVMRRVRAGGMEGSVPSRGRSFLLKPGTQAPGFNRGDFPLCSLPKQDLWLSCTRASVGFWSFWGNRVFYRCGSLHILVPGLKYPLFLFFLELPQLFLREFFFMQKKRPSRGEPPFYCGDSLIQQSCCRLRTAGTVREPAGTRTVPE